jgi:glutaminase
MQLADETLETAHSALGASTGYTARASRAAHSIESAMASCGMYNPEYEPIA